MFTISTLQGLSQALTSQAATPSPWMWLAIVTTAGIAVVLAWALPATKKATAARIAAEEGLAELRNERSKLSETTKSKEKNLDEKRGKISKLQKDLAAQKKKNHAAQEELKGLRDQLAAQRDDFERAQGTKPAFEAADKKDTKPQAAEPERAVAKPVVNRAELDRLEGQISALKAERATLEERLESERKGSRQSKNDLSKLRRRVEDYRRSDLMTKQRLEALDERVSNLGRQYYDAVSEVAALKGEVPVIKRPKLEEPAPVKAAAAKTPAVIPEASTPVATAEDAPSAPA